MTTSGWSRSRRPSPRGWRGRAGGPRGRRTRRRRGRRGRRGRRRVSLTTTTTAARCRRPSATDGDTCQLTGLLTCHAHHARLTFHLLQKHSPLRLSVRIENKAASNRNPIAESPLILCYVIYTLRLLLISYASHHIINSSPGTSREAHLDNNHIYI